MKFPSISEEERRAALSIPAGKIHIVLDTDAKNEIDDQFAIAWALRSPERFCVEAVYAAPFSHDCLRTMFTGGTLVHAPGIHYAESPADGMNQSYDEIIKLYGLLGMPPEGRVFHGSESYIADTGAPVESEACDDLIARAMAATQPLYVAAFGAITNVASAIMKQPEIIKKIVVVWLGGQPLWFSHSMEFNLMQDVRAVQVVLESGVPLVYIPCMNVASLLATTEDEIKTKLYGKSCIGTYLAQNVLDAFQNPAAAAMAAAMFRHSYLAGQEDQPDAYFAAFPGEGVAWSRIIWDVSTIAYLKNPGWAPSTLVPTPQLNDDMTWGSTPLPHKMRTVNYCHRDLIFGDMFRCLAHD